MFALMQKVRSSSQSRTKNVKTSAGRSQGLQTSGMSALSQNDRSSGQSQIRNVETSKGRRVAPHPIPKGQEGMACPITGLFADGSEANQEAKKESSWTAALAELAADPDIIEERKTIAQMTSEAGVLQPTVPSARAAPLTAILQRTTFVPLNVVGHGHRANELTRDLVRAVGGLQVLRRFTALFYKRCEVDPHLDKFIRRHTDPHGDRFATWIVEKFGDGTPWTDERKSRKVDTMQIGRDVVEVSYDRSSAHAAAWHSPKREPHEWGQHFKPEDARVWMRLHFWAAREIGLFEPEYAVFMDYYTRFIGHFISVYSGKSPPFTRESARWSADPQNIKRYLTSGNVMTDVMGVRVEQALAELPRDERVYTGSGHRNSSWPYDL